MDKKKLQAIRDQVKQAHAAATRERDELRVALGALEGARANLSPGHYNTRHAELLQDAAKKIVAPATEALAAARTALALRDDLTSVDAVLSRARFVETIPAPTYPWPYGAGETLDTVERQERRDQHAAMMNMFGVIAEETSRVRWRGELPTYSGAQLERLVRQAAVDGNSALVDMVRREAAGRSWPGGMPPPSLQIAIIDAIQSLPLPPDLQEAATVLDEIDDLAARLSGALHEIQTGDEHGGALHDAAQRLDELAEEHDPLEAGKRYAAERGTQRQQVHAASAKRVASELRRAEGAEGAEGASDGPAAA